MESSLMMQKLFTLGILQFSFRIITFFFNLFLVRYLQRDILGLVNVRLILLYSTIVFIGREPFRKVCLSLNLNENPRKIINLMWLILPFSILISTILTLVWCELLSLPNGYPEYKWVVFMYGLSAVIELLSEPLWLISQINLMVQFRAVIDALALLIRIVFSTLLYVKWPQLGLVAFGLAQVAYCAFISASYFLRFYFLLNRTPSDTHQQDVTLRPTLRRFRDVLPDSLAAFEIDYKQLGMIRGFLNNCLLKQLLTEGERYLMTISNWISLEQQGEFDIVTNLGSLAPRLVFSPVEDSCHLAFSQLTRQGLRARDQPRADDAKQAHSVLVSALKAVLLLGLTIVVFAQAYSGPLLALYAGPDKAGTGTGLLRVFSLYVLALALNGVTECFYYSAVGPVELASHSRKMLFFSALFVSFAALFVRAFGVVGLIWANLVNMSLRICTSLVFIGEFYDGWTHSLSSSIRMAVPHSSVLVAYLLSLAGTMISLLCCPRSLAGQAVHIGIGLCFLVLDLGIVIRTEPEFASFIRRKLKIKSL